MKRQHLIAAVSLLALISFRARAAADDTAAVQGMKEGKIVFDILEGDGQKLLARIETIDETRQTLIRLGLKPALVLTFRGGATRLVQTDPEKIKPEDRPIAAKIAARLEQMSKAPGVAGIEQCAVAIRHQGTSESKVLPTVRIVGNSFVTIMAYQAKGYAYIIP